MAWFKRISRPTIDPDAAKASVPTGVWAKCDGCEAMSLATDVEARLMTCPSCGFHFRLSGRARLRSFLDDDSMVEVFDDILPQDPLGFVDSKPYAHRLSETSKKVGENEAFLTATGRLFGRPIIAGAFVFPFLGGSMGSVVGEKVTRAFEMGVQERLPVVLFSASGGARMQEGILSLMQMAKTAAAIERLQRTRSPYISVLTDPTTGGVAASFSLLGDVIMAEPGALVGFAGPRVIEQTIRQTLPEGFQRAEFLLQHGVIDMVVARHDLRPRIASILDLLVS